MQGIIETVIARCLLDQDFIENFNVDAALLGLPVSDNETRQAIESLDIARIRLLSGFIGKVQHNYLWESFFATKLLLQYYDIELKIFSAYRRRQLSLPKGISRLEQIRNFLDFLEIYLYKEKSIVAFPGLAEVLCHERAMWEVNNSPPQIPVKAILNEISDWKKLQTLIPVINGIIRIRLYNFNPELIISRVKEEVFNGWTPKKKKLFLGYWKEPESKKIRLLEFDDIFAHILLRINQKRSVRAVIAAARRDGLQDMSPSAFREFFNQAVEAGLLNLCLKR